MSTNVPRDNSGRFLRVLRYAHALFGGVLIISLFLVLINAFVLTVFRVDGASMSPTLKNGQLIPVLLLAYAKDAPQRGDVVIVQYAGDERIRFVKRVVGAPGDAVQVKGLTVTLQEDEFYVVGDNRDHSTDSRIFGAIKRNQILGQALNVAPYDVITD